MNVKNANNGDKGKGEAVTFVTPQSTQYNIVCFGPTPEPARLCLWRDNQLLLSKGLLLDGGELHSYKSRKKTRPNQCGTLRKHAQHCQHGDWRFSLLLWDAWSFSWVSPLGRGTTALAP